jgi:hypothetical protein
MCRGLEVQGAEVLRFRCAEVQRGDAEMQHRCRSRDVEVQRCRCAEVQRGPERRRVEMQRCGIGVEIFLVQRC